MALGEAEVKNLFFKWDTDGNGNISKDELVSVLDSLGLDPQVVAEVLQAADVNNDMVIDYSEFISWVFDSVEKLPAEMLHCRPDSIPCTSLRSAADPSRDVCIPGKSVRNGEIVDIYPRRVVNGMVHVTVHDNPEYDKDGCREGWLRRIYLRAIEDGHQVLPAKMVHQRTDTIICTSLRSRNSSDTEYCIDGQHVQNGETVDVLPPRKVENGMVQVLLQNGNKGWIRRIYLQPVGEGAAEGGRGVAGGAAIAAAAAAKHQENASAIVFNNLNGGGGCFDGGSAASADGFRFSLTPGELNDLIYMWVEKKNGQTKRVEEEDGDPEYSDLVVSDKITEISPYSTEEVLACIQKYQDGRAHPKYAGTWYMGDEDKVIPMLEEIKKVVRTADSDATGFYFDYHFSYYSTDIHLGHMFFVAGHLLQMEFAVFDQ